MEWLSRTEMLFGADKVEALKGKRVIVFGVGGVGGYVCEALARSGVGTIDVVDNDTVSVSNLNRQIIALNSTIGQPKVDVIKVRMTDINPEIKVNAINLFYTPEEACKIDFSSYDYIVDAIDTVSGKISLVCEAEKVNVPIISSMGAGNKTDPTAFKVTDIYKTSVCPLAKVMRRELKARGIKKLKVVWSDEEPRKTSAPGDAHRRTVPASCSFVPPVAGYILAGEVIKDLIK